MSTAIAQTNPEARQLDQVKAGLHRLRQHLATKEAFLAEVAGKHMNSERMIRLVLASASTNPLLLQATPESIMVCLMDCARLGLEPSGRGGMWILPFKKYEKGRDGQRTGSYIVEAQAITDYRGELTLARRSGELREISAHSVYEKEHFELIYGDEERLVHKPRLFEDKGQFRGVYAIARLKSGYQRAFMNLAEVQVRRSRSRAAKSGPWVTDFEKMALKTVIREVLNLCPMSSEYRDWVEKEEAREMVDRTEAKPVVDIETITPRQVTEDAHEPPRARKPSAKAQAMRAAMTKEQEPEDEPPAEDEPETSPRGEDDGSEDDDFGLPPEPDADQGLNDIRGDLFQAQRLLVDAFGGDAVRAKALWSRFLPLDINDIPSPGAGKSRVAKAGSLVKRAQLAAALEVVTVDLQELSVKVAELPAGFERDWSLKNLEATLDDRKSLKARAQNGGA